MNVGVWRSHELKGDHGVKEDAKIQYGNPCFVAHIESKMNKSLKKSFDKHVKHQEDVLPKSIKTLFGKLEIYYSFLCNKDIISLKYSSYKTRREINCYVQWATCNCNKVFLSYIITSLKLELLVAHFLGNMVQELTNY